MLRILFGRKLEHLRRGRERKRLRFRRRHNNRSFAAQVFQREFERLQHGAADIFPREIEVFFQAQVLGQLRNNLVERLGFDMNGINRLAAHRHAGPAAGQSGDQVLPLEKAGFRQHIVGDAGRLGPLDIAVHVQVDLVERFFHILRIDTGPDRIDPIGENELDFSFHRPFGDFGDTAGSNGSQWMLSLDPGSVAAFDLGSGRVGMLGFVQRTQPRPRRPVHAAFLAKVAEQTVDDRHHPEGIGSVEVVGTVRRLVALLDAGGRPVLAEVPGDFIDLGRRDVGHGLRPLRRVLFHRLLELVKAEAVLLDELLII